MDISLITSLYRSDQFIQAYSAHLRRVAAEIRSAGLSLEVIIVTNDATPVERQAIAQLAESPDLFTLQTAFVPRETLYASWNRGVEMATGAAIGFWNVDDVRTAEGLIEGHRRIREGQDAVVFSWIILEPRSWLGLFTMHHQEQRTARQIDRDTSPKDMEIQPFFMFARQIVDGIGLFDHRFTSGGDYDWFVRASRKYTFSPCDKIAGYFHYHGKGLSHNAPIQFAEDNVVLVKSGCTNGFRPTDPTIMREAWSRWQSDYTLTPEVEEQLWGNGAQQRWQEWYENHNRHLAERQRSDNLRMLPRLFIDKTGLRPLLARLGVVKRSRPVT